MSQKAFYRYNPATENYDRVYPTAGARYRAYFRQSAVGIVVGVVALILAYNLFELPREKRLHRELDRVSAQIDVLDRRADEAIAVMEEIAARDNNFYRVMMQADPISDARRYAGLERRRNYEAVDSMGDADLTRATVDRLDRLDHMIYSQIKSFDFLADQAHQLKDRTNHIPAIQPISEKYLRAMASGYGYRRDPIYGTTKFHEGMDFSSPVGTPVYATGDGRVTSAAWNSGYGNLVEIDHGYSYTTRYAHLSEISVRSGQQVKRGDLIGKVGNTGKSTGSHLHYEVRLRGVPQNPVNYYFYDLTPDEYAEMIRQAENAGHVMD